MPEWKVTEPNINLYLNDTPMWYQPSRGRDVRFELAYKNSLGSNGVVDASQYLIFGVGTNWNTPWRSYLQASSAPSQADFYLFTGNGSISNIKLDYVDFHTSATLTAHEDPDTYVLTYNNGQRHTYGPSVVVGGRYLWFLTRAESAQGHHAITFQYLVTNSAVRLEKVIDVDGRETTFQYTNTAYYSNLITKVAGPYGLTVDLKYDSQSRLTNIVDVVQLASSFQYDSSNRLSHLITPYGTNRFDYYAGSGWKAIRATELDVRRHLFLQGDGPASLFSSSASDILSLSNYLSAAGISSMFDSVNLHQRNSYYWAPRQYANLTSTVRGKLDNSTFVLSDVLTNDFNKGRTRHWLSKTSDPHTNTYQSLFTGNALALEREPSPQADGSTEGLMTWYDHAGKTIHHEREGYSAYPRLTASRFSATDWRVVYEERQWNGLVTLRRENYGPPGSVAWRTNALGYDNNQVTNVVENGVAVEVRKYSVGLNLLTLSSNALAEATTHTYNDSQLASTTHPNGLITTYAYDGTTGFLSTVIDSDGTSNLRTNAYTYTNGLLRTHTDARSLGTTNTWDALGRLTATANQDGAITHTYDRLDLVKTLDRLGFTNGFAYNGFRQLLRHTNANGRVTTYQYCDCGSLDSIADALGNTTSHTYDNAGRVTRTTFPGGSYVDSSYDAQGHLIRTSDNLGASVTNFYTVDGMPYTASNAFGRVFLRTYDDDHRLVGSIDQNGVSQGYTYDLLGRLTAQTNRLEIQYVAEFSLTEFESWRQVFVYTNNVTGPMATYRDYAGGVLIDDLPGIWNEELSLLGNLTTYDYDLHARKTNEVHWATNDVPVMTNSFAYNAAGDLIRLTDGKAQITTWKHDAFGRVTNKLDATSAELFRYGYDANGRLTTRWSAAKGTTAYSYDAMGNLTFVNYPASPDLTLGYDALNRVTNMLDAVGTTGYGYTSFGALQSEDGPWAADTVTYSHTGNRLRAGLSVAQPNASAWAQAYTYDAANRLSTTTSGAGAFGYEYGSVGTEATPSQLIRRLTFPNGSVLTNQFDAFARHLGTDLRNNAGTLLNQHLYAYNSLDQRTQQTRGAGTSATSSVDYSYDALGQLVDATGKESGGTTNRLQEQFGYAYDAAGNLSFRTNHAQVQTFTVNSLNGLLTVARGTNFTLAGFTTMPATSVTVNGATAERYADRTFAKASLALLDGTNTFTTVAVDALGRTDTNITISHLPASISLAYDLNGNLTTNGTRLLEYDDENQLTRVTEPNAWKAEFVYDGKMRLRLSRDYAWRNGAWALTNEVRRVYDGMLVVQERDQFNLPRVTYTRGQDLSGLMEGAGGIGGLLAMTESSSLAALTSYFHSDGNGNVTCLVDTNQQVVARYLYDPFGNTLAATGPKAALNKYRFSSKEWHEPSGFVYYGYRWYVPDLQRWVNRDPIFDKGFWQLGKVQKRPSTSPANLYLFCFNTPVMAIDPDGTVVNLLAGCGAGALGGAIGGGIGGFFTTGCSWKGTKCGAASGAISGCISGAACSTAIVPLCIAASCVAGVVGSAANQICMTGLNPKDPCTWFDLFFSGVIGCVGGVGSAGSHGAAAIVNALLGVDISALTAICTPAKAL